MQAITQPAHPRHVRRSIAIAYRRAISCHLQSDVRAVQRDRSHQGLDFGAGKQTGGSGSFVEGAPHTGSRMPEALYQIDAVDRKSTRLNSSHANISYAVF